MRYDRPTPGLSQLSIRRKLLLLVLLFMCSILATATLAAYLHRADLIDARKDEIRSIVETVGGQLSELQARFGARMIDQTTLMERTHALLDNARYRQNGYLFLLNSDGLMISNAGRPELEGQSIINLRDSAGETLIETLLDQIQGRDTVFWSYRWAVSESGQLSDETDKVSYVMRIPGSNWLLGSGVHIDDIDQQVMQRLLTLAILTLALLLATAGLALAVARNITDPINQLALATRRLADGTLETDIAGAERSDEVGALARSIGVLQEQAQENRRLRKLSEHARFLEEFDPVTRLYNRQALGEALEREITRQEQHDSRMAVLVIRLVLLREIATRWGREHAQSVLKEIVERLRNQLRVDDLLARHGEDTLTLVRPEVGSDAALRTLLRDILDTIAQPVSINNQPYSLHGRIGVSLYPEDGEQEFQLIGRAEEALRAARQEEREWVWFNSLSSAPVDQRLSLWQDIQVALEQDQFYLVFQPIFQLTSNQPVTAEVLLRWRHPEKGLISPAVFIPFAEQTGLVKRIDRWVIQAVARQFEQWSKRGLALPELAVNLSGISFLRPDLEQILREAFEGRPELLKHLELELTEGVLIEDMERIHSQIDRVRQLGAKVSIDDFGTGYSSLSRIRNLNVDRIKIDRSFIDDIETSTQCCKIIEAILHMAHGLRLQVIAEGVENENQLHELRQMNCDLVQGYLLSRPLERQDYERLLEQDLEIDVDMA
ncbi:MAG: hypothetical protein CMI01_04930 [Oceanospirillaceae bacterium]|nr:hypothetical protein [Oceanospirillaceae bacterium]